MDVLSLILLGASFTVASDPAPDATVTGHRIDRPAVERFVEQLVEAGPHVQISRYETNLCPKVSGLAEEYNAAIEQRIRDVAVSAGLRVGASDCLGNLFVGVAHDRPAWVAAFERHRGSALGKLTSGHVAKLKKSGDPVLKWQVMDVRSSDGQRMTNVGDNPVNPPIREEWVPTRLMTKTRIDIGLTVLLYDSKRTVGLTTQQIADHAAMLALANIDPELERPSTFPSILALFDGVSANDRSEGLTAYDLRFLQALYGIDNIYHAGAQRGAIVKRMLDGR